MIPQTVYTPTKIEGELPKENVLCISEFNHIAAGRLSLNQRGIVTCDTDSIGCNVNYITHYLKPQEGFFFTQKQLEKLLADSFDAGSEYAYHISRFSFNKDEYIKNFLNKDK